MADITVGNLIIGIQTKLTEFKNDMENAGKQTTELADTIDKNKDKIALFGTAFAAVGAAIGVGLGLAASSSMTFNSEMANISTMMGGSTTKTNELKDAISDMSVSVGKSTSDLATGAYQVISAFGDTADVGDQLEIAATAATAGVATTSDAINLLSSVSKGYGDTSTIMLENISDLAFQTVTLGQTTFPELANSIGRVVPLAAQLGVSQGELFAVMATGTGVTGDAAEVSTQLRGILQSLSAPTEAMTTLLEENGYASGEAMIKDLGLVGSLELIKTTAEKSGRPLQDYIGSIEGQTLALVLAGSQNTTYKEKLEAMNEAQNAAKLAFIAQTEGINSAGYAWEQLKQSVTGIAREFGDALQPAIGAVSGVVLTVTETIRNFLQDHPTIATGIAAAAVAVGLVAAAIGTVLLVSIPIASFVLTLSAIGPAIAAAQLAFTALTPIIAVGGPILLAIAAVAAAVYLIYTNWDTITAGFKTLWETVLKPVVDAIGTVFTFVVDGLIADLQEILDFMTPLTDGIKAGWGLVSDAAETVWNGLWALIELVLVKIWDGIAAWVLIAKTVIDVIISIFTTAIAGYVLLFETGIKPVLDGIGTAFTIVTDGIKTGWRAVWAVIESVFKQVWVWFTPLVDGLIAGWNSVSGIAETVWNGIWDTIKAVFDKIYATFKWVMKQLGIDLPDAKQVFTELGDAGKGAASGIDSKWATVKSNFKKNMDEQKTKATGVYADVKKSGVDAADEVAAKDTEATGKIKSNAEAAKTKKKEQLGYSQADFQEHVTALLLKDGEKNDTMAGDYQTFLEGLKDKYGTLLSDQDLMNIASLKAQGGDWETYIKKITDEAAFDTYYSDLKEKYGNTLDDNTIEHAAYLKVQGEDWEKYINDAMESYHNSWKGVLGDSLINFNDSLSQMQTDLLDSINHGDLKGGLDGLKQGFGNAFADMALSFESVFLDKIKTGVTGALSGMGSAISGLAGNIAGLGIAAVGGAVINAVVGAFTPDYEKARRGRAWQSNQTEELFTMQGAEGMLKYPEFSYSEDSRLKMYYAIEDAYAKKISDNQNVIFNNTLMSLKDLKENYWVAAFNEKAGLGYRVLQEMIQKNTEYGKVIAKFEADVHAGKQPSKSEIDAYNEADVKFREKGVIEGIYGRSFNLRDLVALGEGTSEWAGMPHYHSGGIIQGIIGQERTIRALAGEEVLTRSDPRHSENNWGGINVMISGNQINSEMDVRRIAKLAGEEIMKSLKFQVQFAR
ncbi:MAG: phage tail tape measure protein [Dehalococcoidales bacterium]|nr:phage tail tape measure protein [Dehalococcoidales bacterium]